MRWAYVIKQYTAITLFVMQMLQSATLITNTAPLWQKWVRQSPYSGVACTALELISTSFAAVYGTGHRLFDMSLVKVKPTDTRTTHQANHCFKIQLWSGDLRQYKVWLPNCRSGDVKSAPTTSNRLRKYRGSIPWQQFNTADALLCVMLFCAWWLLCDTSFTTSWWCNIHIKPITVLFPIGIILVAHSKCFTGPHSSKLPPVSLRPPTTPPLWPQEEESETNS